jgi:hypothetical protein
MAKFFIRVRRIVREDTTVEVEAADLNAAKQESELIATCIDADKWDCYDCEYWSEEESGLNDSPAVIVAPVK